MAGLGGRYVLATRLTAYKIDSLIISPMSVLLPLLTSPFATCAIAVLFEVTLLDTYVQMRRTAKGE